jgi:hypothetical protein
MKNLREQGGLGQENFRPLLEISQTSFEYLEKLESETKQLLKWLLESRNTVVQLGEGHLNQDKIKMRQAQNALWQDFRSNIWFKQLLTQLNQLEGAPQEQEEQKMLLNKLDRRLNIIKLDNRKQKKIPMTEVDPRQIREKLYRQLEQHWMAEDFLTKDKKPMKLEDFTFRISLWISDISQINHAITELKKQCAVKDK